MIRSHSDGSFALFRHVLASPRAAASLDVLIPMTPVNWPSLPEPRARCRAPCPRPLQAGRNKRNGTRHRRLVTIAPRAFPDPRLIDVEKLWQATTPTQRRRTRRCQPDGAHTPRPAHQPAVSVAAASRHACRHGRLVGVPLWSSAGAEAVAFWAKGYVSTAESVGRMVGRNASDRRGHDARECRHGEGSDVCPGRPPRFAWSWMPSSPG